MKRYVLIIVTVMLVSIFLILFLPTTNTIQLEGTFVNIEGEITDDAYDELDKLPVSINVQITSNIIESRYDASGTITLGETIYDIVDAQHTDIGIVLYHNIYVGGTVTIKCYAVVSDSGDYAKLYAYDKNPGIWAGPADDAETLNKIIYGE